MSVIAEFRVPADEFLLGRALQADPGLRVQLERVIPLGETLIPYVWVTDDSLAAIEAALREAPDIEAFAVVDTVDSEALVRIEWTGPTDRLVQGLLETDGVILTGVGAADTWDLQARFPDHDALATFHRHCADRGITVQLARIHNPSVPADTEVMAALTDPQRETIQTALDAGYFDVPRETNLTGLADLLGVSDTAVSQRLRRGLETLLTATLVSADRTDDDPVDE